MKELINIPWIASNKILLLWTSLQLSRLSFPLSISINPLILFNRKRFIFCEITIINGCVLIYDYLSFLWKIIFIIRLLFVATIWLIRLAANWFIIEFGLNAYWFLKYVLPSRRIFFVFLLLLFLILFDLFFQFINFLVLILNCFI